MKTTQCKDPGRYRYTGSPEQSTITRMSKKPEQKPHSTHPLDTSQAQNTAHNSAPHPTLAVPQQPHRPGIFTVASLYAAYPMTFIAVTWITAGRALLGAAGDLVPIFAISFGPALALILCLGAWWMFTDAHRRIASGQLTRPAATLWYSMAQTTCWVFAFLFGLFIPDYQAGVAVSGIGTLFGSEYVGYASGFGNTFGILTFGMAITATATAWNANRFSARLEKGITDELLEQAAREQSPYEFLD